VEVSVNLIQFGEKEINCAIARDVTDRIKAETALKQYAEHLEEMIEERTSELMETQNQLFRNERLVLLGKLAGGLGHELRNPLGVLSNAVYYLKMVVPDPDENIKEYLDIISSEVQNAEKIVSDLLDFAREKIPEREEVVISKLISRVLAKHCPPENVIVTTNIVPDMPLLFIDPRQVSQVLQNLFTNAYQAMPEGGQLIVGSTWDGDFARIIITDTGFGITPENLKKLFEPLFSTKPRGIGLGLAISQTLVEKNGGSIEVQSVEGEGSTFSVRLPTVKDGKQDR
jgi:signal transduction histidine kinase